MNIPVKNSSIASWNILSASPLLCSQQRSVIIWIDNLRFFKGTGISMTDFRSFTVVRSDSNWNKIISPMKILKTIVSVILKWYKWIFHSETSDLTITIKSLHRCFTSKFIYCTFLDFLRRWLHFNKKIIFVALICFANRGFIINLIHSYKDASPFSLLYVLGEYWGSLTCNDPECKRVKRVNTNIFAVKIERFGINFGKKP